MTKKAHPNAICACTLGLAVVLLAGCGDTPEESIARANHALRQGVPKQALEFADTALKTAPDSADALHVKARAELRLEYFNDSRKTIDHLINLNPREAKPRELLLVWTWFRLESLLKHSDIALEGKVAERYADALNVGRSTAKWFSRQSEHKPHAEYILARCDQYQVRRLEKVFESHEAALNNHNVILKSEKRRQLELEQLSLNSQIHSLRRSVAGRLKSVVEAKPDHYNAARRYTTVLADIERWPDLWAHINQYAGTRNLPVANAWTLVTALQVIPREFKSLDERVQLGRRVQETVTKSEQKSVLWLMNSARVHHMEEQWTEAETLLERGLKQSPNHAGCRTMLGRNLYNQNRFRDAIEILTPLTRNKGHVEARILHAMSIARVDDADRARAILRDVIEEQPDNAEAREAMLLLLAQDGYLNAANHDLEQYISRRTRNPRAIGITIQFAFAHGRHDYLRTLLNRVESMKTLTNDHLKLLVNAWLVLNEREEALAHARRLATRRPDLVETQILLAEAMIANGEDREASRVVSRIHRKHALDETVERTLATLYVRRGFSRKAEPLFKQIVDKEPDDLKLRLVYARVLASMDRRNEALDHVHDVLERDPKNLTAHDLAIRLHQFNGRTDMVRYHLASIDPKSIREDTHPSLLAQLRLRDGKTDEAMRICNRALLSGQRDVMLRLLLANIYRASGRHDHEELHLLAMLRMHPHNPLAYALVEDFFARHSNYAKGTAEFEKLVAVNPSMAAIKQASLLLRAKQHEAALIKLTKAFDLMLESKQPGLLKVADAMAAILVRNGKRPEAHAVYQKLVEKGIRLNEVRLRQIGVNAAKENDRALEKKLESFAQKLPASELSLQQSIIRPLSGLAGPERAIIVIDQWLAQSPGSVRLLRAKAELLIAMEKVSDAIAILEQAIEAAPENLDLRLMLARAHQSAFDWHRAETVYLEAAKLNERSEYVARGVLARMYLTLGLYQQAIRTFDTVQSPGRVLDVAVLLAMGLAQRDTGNRAAAKETLERIPQSATLEYCRAQVALARMDQLSDSADNVEQRIEKLMSSPRTQSATANVLLSLNFRDPRIQELIAVGDRAIQMNLLTPTLKTKWLGARAILQAEARDWPQLLDTLEQLSEAEPEQRALTFSRIAVLVWLNRKEDARELYAATPFIRSTRLGPLTALLVGLPPSKARTPGPETRFFQSMIEEEVQDAASHAGSIKSHPSLFASDLANIIELTAQKQDRFVEPSRRLGLALIAIRSGLPQLAQAIAEQVTKENPEFPAAHGMLIWTYLDQGKPLKNALEYLQKLSSDSALGLLVQSRILLDERQYDDASRLLDQLFTREPHNTYVRFALTTALQSSGRWKEAVPHWRQLIDSNSIYASRAANNYAWYWAHADPSGRDQAYAIAMEALNKYKNDHTLMDTTGSIEILRGNHTAALKHLNQAIVSKPNNSLVHFHLGVVHYTLDNDAWAQFHLERAAADTAPAEHVRAARALLKTIRN